MRRPLQILSLLFLAGAILWWIAAGANPGWTKTSVPMKTLDEITGLEGITYRDRFVPGIDFLGAGLLGSGLLAGLSFIFRKPQTRNESK